MLQRVRTRRFLDPVNQRNLPIGAAGAADDTAERAPFAEVARLDLDAEMPRRLARPVEMKAVARGAAGQRRGQRRRTAFEIAARAEDAVGIDDDAGVAHRQML